LFSPTLLDNTDKLFYPEKYRKVTWIDEERLPGPEPVDLFSLRDLLGIMVFDDILSEPERVISSCGLCLVGWDGDIMTLSERLS